MTTAAFTATNAHLSSLSPTRAAARGGARRARRLLVLATVAVLLVTVLLAGVLRGPRATGPAAPTRPTAPPSSEEYLGSQNG